MLLFPSTSVEAAGGAWDWERWWRVGRQLKNRPVGVLTNGTTIQLDYVVQRQHRIELQYHYFLAGK